MKFKIFLLALIFFQSYLIAQTDTTFARNNEDPDPNAFMQIEKEPEALNLDEIKKKIVYPPKAKDLGIQGKVVVRVLLNEKGLYKKHIVLRTPHEYLTEEVVKHVPNIKFSPGYLSGKAVKCWVTIPFNFNLDSPIEEEESELTPPPRMTKAPYKWDTGWEVSETNVKNNSEITTFIIPNSHLKAVSVCSFEKIPDGDQTQIAITTTLKVMGAKVIKKSDYGQIFEMTKENQRLIGKIVSKNNYLCVLMIGTVDKKSTKAVIQMLESKKVVSSTYKTYDY